jgi:hypothetical protein
MKMSFNPNIYNSSPGIEATTLDDSYLGTGLRDFLVVAQVPNDMDIRWFDELRYKLKRPGEIKAKDVLRNWDSFDRQLQTAIKRGISRAEIAIYDPRPYFEPYENSIRKIWPELTRKTQQEIGTKISNLVQKSILQQPRVLSILRQLNRNALDEEKLRRRLKKPHNVKTFVERSICAFIKVYDENIWEEAYQELLAQRFIFPQDSLSPEFKSTNNVYSKVLLKSLRADRYFDEGNFVSTKEIIKLREAVSRELEFFISPRENTVGRIVEINSESSAHAQISDIAAGYARYLYQQNERMRKLKDHFKSVIYNGRRL